MEVRWKLIATCIAGFPLSPGIGRYIGGRGTDQFDGSRLLVAALLPLQSRNPIDILISVGRLVEDT